MPGARRMDRNSREYIRGTAQRPGKRGQIELVYVKEQWAPPVSCEQDNDDGAARKRERPRRKFLDVLRADIQEVKYGNQWFAVWSEEKLKCNLSALLTLAVLHSSLKCISYSVIHMRTHTRAHTELQCKAATGATSAFGLHAAGDQNTNPPQSRSRFTGGWHYHSASLCGGICTVSGVCQEKNKREGNCMTQKYRNH